MRWSLALAGALAWVSACGAENLSSRPGGEPGGSGGGGTTTATTSDGGAQAGEAGCPAPACTCDSEAAECQPVLTNLCLGSYCPPSLDDAMLVANWPLDASTAPYMGRVQGRYVACPDGHRFFDYRKDETDHWFYFDAAGRLGAAVRLDNGSMCTTASCATDTTQESDSGCYACQMYADPLPARTATPPLGQSNGFDPLCEIDGNGRWFMPDLDQTN